MTGGSNLEVFDLFPSIKSAGRRSAFLPRVLRGEFPWFIGTTRALRLPAVHPAVLRYLRLAVPPVCTRSFRSLVDECPTKAWSWEPGGSSRDFTEETAGSRKFLGNLDCPFAHVQSTPAGRLHQTITVQPRGPWYEKSKGSHERPFDAQ